eukprot:1568583-Rhodomonas_salina.1
MMCTSKTYAEEMTEVSSAIGLRACYAMSGTDIAFGDTCYSMRGTDLAPGTSSAVLTSRMVVPGVR